MLQNIPKTKDSTITYYQARKRLQTYSNDKVSTFYLIIQENSCKHQIKAF